jgi:hypothetical protein
MAIPHVPGGLVLLEAPSQSSAPRGNVLWVKQAGHTSSAEAMVPMLDWPSDLFAAFTTEFEDAPEHLRG